jgi:hypothetical protein
MDDWMTYGRFVKNVTDKISVLYDEAQHLDRETSSLMLDIYLRNDTSTPIVGRTGEARKDLLQVLTYLQDLLSC